ncbi:hypothetical protein ACFSKU_01385 [Pontibacter silvestris]|uniref:Uncharacterized protein n=1 Tax=Pontibacter silvestris TaxID=2305183 RepID=A0ABW4WUR2_9BACT|nr:hypothetical protein [Pontibacter silvestris]
MVLIQPEEEVEHAESPLRDPPPLDGHEAFRAWWFGANLQFHSQQVLFNPFPNYLLIGRISQDFPHPVQIVRFHKLYSLVTFSLRTDSHFFTPF